MNTMCPSTHSRHSCTCFLVCGLTGIIRTVITILFRGNLSCPSSPRSAMPVQCSWLFCSWFLTRPCGDGTKRHRSPGRLASITHKPRKPVDLGAMVRNAAKAITGTSQRLKQHMQENKVIHTPHWVGTEDWRLPIHVAKVLQHQVEDIRLKEGGRVCEIVWLAKIVFALDMDMLHGIA